MEELRASFASRHHIRLPAFLDPDLLATVRHGVVGGSFVDRAHDGIGVEQCLEDGPATGLLDLLFNDGEVFEFVLSVTGCPAIGCFQGRVYQFVPAAGHFDSWHDDMGMGRLIAMSINLGGEFEGGVLQLARRGEPGVLAEIANTGPGDAVFFRLADSLEHRVTPVDGIRPRVAYAGWFRSYPDVVEIWRRRFDATSESSHPRQAGRT